MTSIFHLLLAALIVGVAAETIFARKLFTAVVGFVAYGLLLALVWVSLHTVDVALAEAAIGGGLTSVLLLGAAIRLRDSEARAEAERLALPWRIAAAALSAIVAAGLAAFVLSLPDPAPSLAPAAVESMPATGLGNPVTAVLMAYRATDTLLEKVVLVLALVGVWSLAADRLWGGRPGPEPSAPTSGPLDFLARLLPPAGLVFGVYLVWNSADHPGGAFQGATIIAAMWQLVMLAGLSDAPPLSGRALRLCLAAGPVAFLAVGLSGLAFGDAFLAYPVAIAKPIILVVEAGMILSITLTLGLLMAGPPRRRTGA